MIWGYPHFGNPHMCMQGTFAKAETSQTTSRQKQPSSRWCQVWFMAHQMGLPCMLRTPHQAIKYLCFQCMEIMHTGTSIKKQYYRFMECTGKGIITVILSRNEGVDWTTYLHSTRGIQFMLCWGCASAALHKHIPSPLPRSANKFRWHTWLKCMPTTARRVPKPAVMVLQLGAKVPCRQGSQSTCGTESCDGSNADGKTKKFPVFAALQTETNIVQERVTKKSKVHLRKKSNF